MDLSVTVWFNAPRRRNNDLPQIYDVLLFIIINIVLFT